MSIVPGPGQLRHMPMFSDQILAAAILDRLLHVSTTINIREQNYRLREKRKAGVFQELPIPTRRLDRWNM